MDFICKFFFTNSIYGRECFNVSIMEKGVGTNFIQFNEG